MIAHYSLHLPYVLSSLSSLPPLSLVVLSFLLFFLTFSLFSLFSCYSSLLFSLILLFSCFFSLLFFLLSYFLGLISFSPFPTFFPSRASYPFSLFPFFLPSTIPSFSPFPFPSPLFSFPLRSSPLPLPSPPLSPSPLLRYLNKERRERGERERGKVRLRRKGRLCRVGGGGVRGGKGVTLATLSSHTSARVPFREGLHPGLLLLVQRIFLTYNPEGNAWVLFSNRLKKNYPDWEVRIGRKENGEWGKGERRM